MDIVMVEAVESPVEQLRRRGLPVTMPPEYIEYSIFVEVLRTAGLLDYLGGVVLARRAGAFEVIDLVLFLTCFFSASSRTTSIVDFAGNSAMHGPELAAIGGRGRWLTQASVSRALGAVDEVLAREVTRRLLGLTRRALLDSELCAGSGYRDGTGTPWRVLHWDTTADTVRRRALPEGDGLPQGARLGEGLAAPGYAGRKRGEGVFARSIVSDATSSLWVHMELDCGSGSVTDQMARAVTETVEYLGGSADSLAFSVMICDGVSGGLPQARALLSGGMHVLTRISDYASLQAPKTWRHVERGAWHAVEDSRSGPRREALELGTRVFDGQRVRVLASRFRVRSDGRAKRHGAGITIGEWHYELFLSSLPSSGWAANDLVTLYYGRTAIENRFAAEDREFDLSRVFSFSRPGQMLACAVAMALWNHRVAAGLASVAPTAPLRLERPRPARAFEDEEEAAAAALEAANAAAAADDPPEADPSEPDAAHAVDTGDADARNGASDTAVMASDAAAVDHTDAIHAHTEEWCRQHPGWSFDGRTLRCPAGRSLSQSLRQRWDRLNVRFRAAKQACFGCALRLQCTDNDSPHFRKEFELTLVRAAPDDTAAKTPAAPVASTSKPTVKPAAEPTAITQAGPTALPPLLPDAPILLPAVLRKRAREIYAASILTVVVPPLAFPDIDDVDDEDRESATTNVDETHLAVDPQTRQRRRQTIAQRVSVNARPEHAAPTVVLQTPSKYAERLQRLYLAVRSA